MRIEDVFQIPDASQLVPAFETNLPGWYAEHVRHVARNGRLKVDFAPCSSFRALLRKALGNLRPQGGSGIAAGEWLLPCGQPAARVWQQVTAVFEAFRNTVRPTQLLPQVPMRQARAVAPQRHGGVPRIVVPARKVSVFAKLRHHVAGLVQQAFTRLAAMVNSLLQQAMPVLPPSVRLLSPAEMELADRTDERLAAQRRRKAQLSAQRRARQRVRRWGDEAQNDAHVLAYREECASRRKRRRALKASQPEPVPEVQAPALQVLLTPEERLAQAEGKVWTKYRESKEVFDIGTGQSRLVKTGSNASRKAARRRYRNLHQPVLVEVAPDQATAA